MYAILQNFIRVNVKILKNNLYTSGHTGGKGALKASISSTVIIPIN